MKSWQTQLAESEQTEGKRVPKKQENEGTVSPHSRVKEFATPWPPLPRVTSPTPKLILFLSLFMHTITLFSSYINGVF